MDQNDLRSLPGIGEARAKALEKLGIRRVEDFLTFFPRGYEDRREVKTIASLMEGDRCSVRAMVGTQPRSVRISGGRTVTRVKVFDSTGSMEMIFFNKAFVADKLEPGKEYVFYGRTEFWNRSCSMVSPDFEEAGRARLTGRILPVYRLTGGMTRNIIMMGADIAMQRGLWPKDVLPEEYAARFMPIREAVRELHRPTSPEKAAEARRRFIFEELFLYSLGAGIFKKAASGLGIPLKNNDPKEFYSLLPFTLTGDQRRAIEDCFKDMQSGKRLNRLIQGDVGSGKTMVAAACCWLAAKSGYQAAIMAPTEILARQHYKNLAPLFEKCGIRARLLVSAMSAKEKRMIKEDAALGTADVFIGTHALLQKDVSFRDAALFVVDEQHRFGVEQRAALGEKSRGSHLLVMSATPIPRTLTLIIYGDLDISIISELPPGRQKVRTFSIGDGKRRDMWEYVRAQVKEGGQAYIVCPMIEGSDDPDGKKAASELHDTLSKNVFPELKVGLLHGKMKAAEKDAVMASFASGETHILVCTTVVEVGVDVPNANMMIIENAQFFGLSQLHQLRGRVGRGSRKSWCFLMNGDGGALSKARMEVLCSTSDGFKIAEEDLKIRGPGDFFGNRQHGLPDFRLADLAADEQIFRDARSSALELLEKDPMLSMHPALREKTEKLFSDAETSRN